MKNYLLIHGSQHGAWCWKELMPFLKSSGHKVYAIDLPGSGQDTTLRQTVDLSTYRKAISNFLINHPNEIFTIVGHSLAGFMLPFIYLDNPDSVEELIFLAALVLNEGETVIDLVPKERHAFYYEIVNASSDNTLSFNFEQARKIFYTDFSEEKAKEFYSQLTPQPFSLYTRKSTISASSIAIKKRYIGCTNDKALPLSLCESFAKKLGVPLEEINAGHSMMLEKPKELAMLINKD